MHSECKLAVTHWGLMTGLVLLLISSGVTSIDSDSVSILMIISPAVAVLPFDVRFAVCSTEHFLHLQGTKLCRKL